MTQFNFAIGNIAAAPVGGGTPYIFGTINGASVDIDADAKMLYGQNQFPDDVAVGKKKITGKVSFARVDVNVLNALFFNMPTVSSGNLLEAISEAHSVPASSPYTIVATNGSTYDSDMGVYYASTGLPLVQVASAPTTGQYTVSVGSGTYTFTTGDAGKALLFNYSYTNSSSGQNVAVVQTLMGNLATFQLTLLNNYKGKTFGFRLYTCVATKLNLPTKQDDFLIQELDFAAYANAAGSVINVYTG